MAKIAIILSGCGFQDGSEIHESVLTMLELDKQGLEYQCMAPSVNQHIVFDHYQKSEDLSNRQVLSEAARIARCEILDIKNCNSNEYDGMIFPGGFGAISTLSSFATDGKNYQIQESVLKFAKEIADKNKPAGFICISPCLIPAIYNEPIELTIGSDRETADKLEQLGCRHSSCDASNIVVDMKSKVVTTPAYMLGKSISEVAEGIKKLVLQIKMFL